jgi:hypothetical protein
MWKKLNGCLDLSEIEKMKPNGCALRDNMGNIIIKSTTYRMLHWYDLSEIYTHYRIL